MKHGANNICKTIGRLMFEAMEMLRFKEFVDALPEEEDKSVTLIITRLENTFQSQTNFLDVLNSECMNELAAKYYSLITQESKKRPTFAL